jgi:glycogen debranching enzyme
LPNFEEVGEVVEGRDRDVAAEPTGNGLRYEYGYQAADGTETRLQSTVSFSDRPDELVPGRATFELTLPPQASRTLSFAVIPSRGQPETDADAGDGDDPLATRRFDRAAATQPSISPLFESEEGPITTGDQRYDRSFAQAARDLTALTTATEHGPVPVAGTPWFATVFGRDALLTAYLSLPVAPDLAVGSLRYLAANRGQTTNPERDEEPGKILHELRQGELAARGAIPHSPYYGTIDATPLWVVLLHETYRWTGDDELVESLWPALEQALGWIETATARTGDDPFLYYRQTDESGVVHKAWRDTTRSVQFADGQAVAEPLASVEVQGYVYDALSRAATLYREVKGDDERATELESRARRLRSQFDATFWLPDNEFFGAALTVGGDVVDTDTSNVGHCLWSGVVPEERQAAVVERLLSEELFTGWGVRTMGKPASGFDPVSYHTGSVWPHDTAVVSLGLANEGFHGAAERVATGLLEASTRFDYNRLPELFCGFDDSRSPVPYPAACTPQAWAAGAPFGLLRALFALEPGDQSVRIGRTPDALANATVDPITDAWEAGALPTEVE